MLTDKRIVLGVTGSVAAYKAADLASRLVKAGADVTAVLTPTATEFVGPLTFTALTGNPAVTSFTDTGSGIPHIDLEKQADIIVVAPATANTIARLAHGLADDVLCATVLSAACPVIVAPAMHHAMWENETTQLNVAGLRSRGVNVMDPEWGDLASGDIGWGRLADVGRILREIALELSAIGQLKGKRILVTAGGTREPYDPVRYLGNPSSGKMGFALAREFARRGAETILVAGPSALGTPGRVHRVDVLTAADLQRAVAEYFEHVDGVVMAAAVTDYRFKNAYARKKARDRTGLAVELVPNPDILAGLGRKKTTQVLVGFAAETGSVVRRAREKLVAKNLDLIVANDVSLPDSGFAADDNQATLMWRDRRLDLPKMPKRALARVIVDHVADLLLKTRTEA